LATIRIGNNTVCSERAAPFFRAMFIARNDGHRSVSLRIRGVARHGGNC
jgi:hypothetical protein